MPDEVMSDDLEKLQHKTNAAQRALAETEGRRTRHDPAQQESTARDFDETCKEIQQAHQEWQSAIDAVRDLVFMHDKDFRILRCNRAYQRCAGISFKKIIGRPYYDVFPKFDAPLPSCIQALKSVKNIGEYRDEDEDEDGEIFVVGKTSYRSRSFAVTDEHDSYLYSVHIIEDITDRKNAEDARQASEAQLSDALQMARAGAWLYDVESDRFTLNDNFYRIFGASAAEVGGYILSSAEYAGRFCHPEDAPLVGREIAAAINSPDPNYSRELEHRIIRKNGDIGYIAVRFFIVKDASGKTVRTHGVNQDITARKRNEQELLRLNRTLRTLSAGNMALVHAADEQQLFVEICRILVEVGSYALAWISRREDTKSVKLIASAGDDSYLEDIDISWADEERGRGPTGTAIRTGEIQINQDFATDPSVAPWREAAEAHDFRSSISLPLKDDSGTFAALTIYSKEKESFDPEEVNLLKEMSSDLAYGIGALRDKVGRQVALAHLQRSLQQAVEALASTVEARDVYTAGHQRRVSEIAVAMARRMGLPEERIEGISLAGVVHDIGKMQVPSDILNKPGKLSPLELQFVKQHAEAGYNILKGIDFPWPIAEMIRQHHERLDGSGYPRGLNGDEILPEAKILAVADVVEAMMSHRPYRAALGIDAALAEIERGKGSIYDPAAVEACLALFRVDGFKLA